MTQQAIPQKPDPSLSGKVAHVMLALPNVNRSRQLVSITKKDRVIEDLIGDEVVVRFGVVVVQVPAEWVAATEE